MVKNKGKIIVRGPPVRLEKYVKEFKKKWSKWFVKKGVIYSFRKSISIKERLIEST